MWQLLVGVLPRLWLEAAKVKVALVPLQISENSGGAAGEKSDLSPELTKSSDMENGGRLLPPTTTIFSRMHLHADF